MYVVHMSKRYSVADARKNLAELLTATESGETVVIERRGVTFPLTAGKAKAKAVRRNVVAACDPAVEAGSFTWEAAEGGLAFTPRDPGS